MNLLRRELRTIIQFKIASITTRKSLGICLTKKVKGLYNENFKAQKKLKNILDNRTTFSAHELAEFYGNDYSTK